MKAFKVMHEGRLYESMADLAKALNRPYQTIYSQYRAGKLNVSKPVRVKVVKTVDEWRY